MLSYTATAASVDRAPPDHEAWATIKAGPSDLALIRSALGVLRSSVGAVTAGCVDSMFCGVGGGGVNPPPPPRSLAATS